jgi:uncharacterized RDD family membrane protein YckC
MKCPKCDYLGFDTGVRCKNCGYEFSLMIPGAERDQVDLDLPLHTAGVDAPSGDPSLPLFARESDDADDAPLIKVPAAPRAPLAVRRTPEIPRLRAVPRPIRRSEPALEFFEEIEPVAPTAAVSTPPEHHHAGGPGARSVAMAVDHVILFAIDVAVLYFTLRIAGLTMADWRSLPAVPLLMFLLFLKLGYFCAFTAVGGQTIGKMAAKLRVVTDTDEAVDGVRAIQRTIAAAGSALVFGLGFVPALIGGERRTLHDRVAHTRVVTLRSA